ncbi:MAG: ABC transporter ATP-binding protein [Acetobacteraceae bacterium]
MTEPDILQVQDVTKRFAGLVAVDAVSFGIRRGELVSIIGPNGAGKTTLFNMLTGQLKPSSGDVRFCGASINRLKPYQRARLGLGRTFQISKPLVELNVLENVMVGAFLHHRSPHAARDRATAVLEEIGLADQMRRRAFELTLSERRRLEVARALALEPQIILLDEVMAGLNASETALAIELFQRLHARGLTLLVIEHNLKVVRALSQRVIVLDHGALIAEGNAEEILVAPQVVEAYLGRRKEWQPS